MHKLVRNKSVYVFENQLKTTNLKGQGNNDMLTITILKNIERKDASISYIIRQYFWVEIFTTHLSAIVALNYHKTRVVIYYSNRAFQADNSVFGEASVLRSSTTQIFDDQ